MVESMVEILTLNDFNGMCTSVVKDVRIRIEGQRLHREWLCSKI